MDWRAQLAGLFSEIEGNLRQAKCLGQARSYAAVTPKKAPPSYALLRHGVSPGDPHLIAPAVPCYDLIPPVYPGCPAAAARAPAMPAAVQQAVAAQSGDLGHSVEGLKGDLKAVSGQLAQLRQAAASWQQVTASVAGLDGRCAEQAGQLAALSAGVTELRAAQVEAEEDRRAHKQEVQAALGALRGRPDGLAACDGSSSGAGTAALAPLTARLQATEQALAALQARVEQQAAPAAVAQLTAAAGTADAAALAGQAAAVAHLQSELGALWGAQSGAAQAQEAQRQQLDHVAAQITLLQGAHEAAAQQAAAQQAELASQLGQLQQAQEGQAGATQQQGGRMERLASQLAELAGRVVQQQEQQAALRAAAAMASGVADWQQVAAQAQANASAVEALQRQVAELAALQAAVDDANQRLFELRVEVQNAAGDADITTASLKRQAASAEQQAGEAMEAAADIRQLAAGLQQELAGLRQQLARARDDESAAAAPASTGVSAELAGLLQEQVRAEVPALKAELASCTAAPDSSASLAGTVDHIAAELAAVKLTLAELREAADGAAVAAWAEAATREEQVTYVQAAAAALDHRLQQLASSGGADAAAVLANAGETAACLSAVSNIVHRQQEELAQLKRQLQGAAVGSASEDAKHPGMSVADLGAVVAGLQQQLEAVLAQSSRTPAALAAEQQQVAAHGRALEEVQRQQADMQHQLAALTATTAAALSSSQPQGLLPDDLRQEVDARVYRTEATVAAALEELAAQMAAVVARVERAEMGAAAPTAAVLPGQRQQQQPTAIASRGALSREPSMQLLRQQSVPAGTGTAAAAAALFRPLSRQRSNPPQAELPVGQYSTVSSRGPHTRLSQSCSLGSSSSEAVGGCAMSAAVARQGSDADVPLRLQWSSSQEQEAGRQGEAVEAGMEGAVSRRRTRSTSTGAAGSGAASGGSTPRYYAAGPSPRGEKFTPRSRHWAAAVQAEHGGGDSSSSTPRQDPACFSSFGELPLPMSGSSCMVTPRDELDDRIAGLGAELAQPSQLEESQREVLQSGMGSLKQQRLVAAG